LAVVYIGGVVGEVKLMLRLPPELHAAIKEAAQAEDRSLNAQITRVLREWVAEQERRTGERRSA
jgi:hypothetical protein